MGVMFFAAVVPIAWLVRRRGHDLLRLQPHPEANSYWIERSAEPGSLAKQF